MHTPSHPIETCAVDVTESQSLAYWLDTLGVDEYHLRTAVAEVGTSAQDVRCYLGMPGSSLKC
jgi:hypothetical protein